MSCIFVDRCASFRGRYLEDFHKTFHAQCSQALTKFEEMKSSDDRKRGEYEKLAISIFHEVQYVQLRAVNIFLIILYGK